jgi:hypothetical protein
LILPVIFFRCVQANRAFSILSSFEKNKRNLKRSLCCLRVSLIVARLRLGKNVPTATNTKARIEELSNSMFSLRCMSYQIFNMWLKKAISSSGVIVARLRESWERKIWSRVPRDSEPTLTMLARASSNFPNRTISSSQNFLYFLYFM